MKAAKTVNFLKLFAHSEFLMVVHTSSLSYFMKRIIKERNRCKVIEIKNI